MAMTIFWVFLLLALICALISESIQVYRQRKYIKLMAESTGIGQNVSTLTEQEKILTDGIAALQRQVDGFNENDFLTYTSLLDEMINELAGQDTSEKLKQIRSEIKIKTKNGNAVNCKLSNETDKKKAIRLTIDAFNCRVEGSLLKLKSSNAGHIVAEINNSYDLINMNAIVLNTSIDKSYLKLRIQEVKLGAILHEQRERMKEEQRALREEIREEERVNREQERLQREAEREEQVKQEMLRAAQEAAINASEAERAVYEERVRQLEAEVDAAKAKTQRMSMAQLTRVGTVYIISNIGSFGEGVLKIGMTRRLNPKERIEELGSASVPFEFDVHALIKSTDAPKLENELHRLFTDQRVNKVNFRKEFFRIGLLEVKEALEKIGVHHEFTMLADAKQFRETQRINAMPQDQRLALEHQLEQQQQS